MTQMSKDRYHVPYILHSNTPMMLRTMMENDASRVFTLIFILRYRSNDRSFTSNLRIH
jgi:hypothetical protein